MDEAAAGVRQQDLEGLKSRFGLEKQMEDLTTSRFSRAERADTLAETKRHNIKQEEIAAERWRNSVNAGLGRKGFEAQWDAQGNMTGITSIANLDKLNKIPLKQAASKELRDFAGLADQMFELNETFKGNFGGGNAATLILGNMENTLKRWVPGLEWATGTEGQSKFWSNLTGLDNLIRHPIFGSAFTITEKELWKDATSSIRDDPKFILANIRRRAVILDTAMTRAARTLAVRHDADEISSAIGGDLPPPGFAAPIINAEDADRRYELMKLRRLGNRTPFQENTGAQGASNFMNPRPTPTQGVPGVRRPSLEALDRMTGTR